MTMTTQPLPRTESLILLAIFLMFAVGVLYGVYLNQSEHGLSDVFTFAAQLKS